MKLSTTVLALALVGSSQPSLALRASFGQASQAHAQDWNAIQDEAVRLLQQYVRIDTSNPPGDTRKTADFLESILKREGIAVTRYESAPGKAILVARLKGTGSARPIMLLHHMDVVPADASRWKVDPFAATIRDGELWGRGAMDMKGLGVAHLLAFLTLERRDVPLARDVILMAVPDEEVGGALGARWMIERHFAELDPEYVLDEGGFGSEDLFAPGKLVFGISVAEKQIAWMKVRAEGVAGHGSQPHDQNPNQRLVRALTRLLEKPMPAPSNAVLDTMKERIGPFAPNKFTNAIQNSTIALTALEAGVGNPKKVNVIPSVAEALIDCRLLPGTDAKQWVEDVKARLADVALHVEVTYLSDPSVVSPPDSPLYRALESAIMRHYPSAVVTPMLIPYGTDSNAFRHKGAKSYGLMPAVLSADIVASMHGDAERVPVAGLGPAARIFYEALVAVASR
jgi:acetylornithine deacetylase/succinyl-diaminopimelate desuccinylase-like protein